MATARILLLLLCTAPAFGHWLPERHLLSSRSLNVASALADTSHPAGAARLIALAKKELAVRELRGKNEGPRVEVYLRYVGLGKGHAWCAAFVSWLHGQAGFAQPRSGWSPALFPGSKQLKVAKPGAVLGIYVPALKRIAHVGLVIGIQQDWVQSIEGNTNPSGSREGDGVYSRLRHRRTISKYAYFIF
jgi:hypothetical protein